MEIRVVACVACFVVDAGMCEVLSDTLVDLEDRCMCATEMVIQRLQPPKSVGFI